MSVLRKEEDALKAILVYLKNAVEKNEGIPLTKLQGVLSRLPPKARGNFSASPATIRLVTRKFPGTIFVDADDKVYSCVHLDEPSTAELSRPTSGREDEIIELCNVHGTVQYLAPSNIYGFIMVNYPVKANVFFDRKAAEGGKHKDLRKSNVKVGSAVLLSAVRSPSGHKAKFQATCVECYDGPTVAMPADSPSSPEQSPQSGDGKMIFNRTGFIHSIKSNHGFITFGLEQQLCAFFHRDKVKKTVLKPNQKLSDVFAVGDAVCFNARPSSRSTKTVKWEATMVTKVVEHREPSQNDDADEDEDDDDGGDEVFMSGDESELAELLEGYVREDVVDAGSGLSAVAHADWEASSHQHPEPSNTELSSGYSAGRKLLGTEGTLYPDSATTALVFCLGLDTALVVEIGVVYRHGRQIKSFNELLSNSSIDGAAEVLVDAVEVASDVWAATLVWTGERPLRHYKEGVPNLALGTTILGSLGHDPVSRDGICIFSSIPEPDCSVAAYQAARGTVLRVGQCSAVCAVQEPGRLRRIEFTCFYRNGTAYYCNLDQVLREGAAVSVNYMVGVADDGNEKVYCGLVWQGLTPPCVDQLSQEEFRQMLNIIDVQPGVPSTAAAIAAPQGVQFRGNAVHGSHPSCGSAVALVGKQGASFDLPSSVACSGPSPLFIPTKSSAPGKQWANAWGQQHVQNVSVDEGSTSHVESSPVLTVPPVPSVPTTSRAESSMLAVPTRPPMPAYNKVKATAAAKSMDRTGVQNGEAPWKRELTGDCFSMDEEITMEELNELFEEDEVVMLGCEDGWRGREVEEEEVTPNEPTQGGAKERHGWTSRLEAGDAGGKVDVAKQASHDDTAVKLEANIPGSASTDPNQEMAAGETTQAPEASSQQEGCTPEADETDVVLWQETCNSLEGEEEVERVSAAVVEDIFEGHYTFTGAMFRRMIGVIVREIRNQLQDFLRKTVLEVVQKMMTERRDAATQVDGGGPSCAGRPV